ncbi:MAG: aminotransferase class V-fold PLP-dependent enzyme, partial [Tissierellales bacterium]
GLYHGTVATVLSVEGGIGVRNGCFCAQPYVQKLLKVSEKQIERYKKDSNLSRPGTVRISYGMYNDFKEINVLVELLHHIVKNIDFYNQKYKIPPPYQD